MLVVHVTFYSLAWAVGAFVMAGFALVDSIGDYQVLKVLLWPLYLVCASVVYARRFVCWLAWRWFPVDPLDAALGLMFQPDQGPHRTPPKRCPTCNHIVE